MIIVINERSGHWLKINQSKPEELKIRPILLYLIANYNELKNE